VPLHPVRARSIVVECSNNGVAFPSIYAARVQPSANFKTRFLLVSKIALRLD
jgi:hypothetical protein